MGKILKAIIVALIIASGIYSMSICIDYINRRSDRRGESTIATKIEIEDNIDDYSITYELNSGTANNPEKYNLFTKTFMLQNPTRDNYKFTGWTGSNGDTPQLSVTICKGSCGDLHFVANFALILEAPELNVDNNVISWNEIYGASGYKINVNGVDVQTVIHELSSPLYTIKNYCIPGTNIIKVKAIGNEQNNEITTIVDGPYSNSINYSTSKLEAPVVSFSGFNIHWNQVNNAECYKVNIGVNSVIVSETSINVLNYVDLFTVTHTTNIRVQALASLESNIMDSALSNNVAYVRPTLDSIEFEVENGILSWNFDEKVTQYSVHINGEVAENYTGNAELNLSQYASDFISGTNAIRITASSLGYDDMVAVFNFEYTKPDELENTTLNFILDRHVNSWTLYNGAYVSINRTTLNVTEMYVDAQFYVPELTITKMLLKNANPTNFELLLNNCTLAEIAILMDNAYEQGMTTTIINASGFFKYRTDNIVLAEYVPQQISINARYNEMYIEPTFDQNEIVLSKNEGFYSNYYYVDGKFPNDNWGSSYTHQIYTSFQFDDREKNQFSLGCTKYDNGNITYELSYRGQTLTLSDFNTYLLEAKFRINDNFYFKFTKPIEEVIEEINSYLNNERIEYVQNSNYQHTYDTFYISSEIIINDFIKVYSNDGIQINTNCLFKLTYNSRNY